MTGAEDSFMAPIVISFDEMSSESTEIDGNRRREGENQRYKRENSENKNVTLSLRPLVFPHYSTLRIFASQAEVFYNCSSSRIPALFSIHFKRPGAITGISLEKCARSAILCCGDVKGQR